MNALDPWSVVPLILTAAFGGSGVAAWVITYYQIAEQRRQRAQENFSRFVITPSFLRFMGLIIDLSGIFESIHNQQDIIKHGPQIRELLLKADDERAKLTSTGLPILSPPKFLAQFLIVEDLLLTMGGLTLKSSFEDIQQTIKTFDVEVTKLSDRLRSVLGFSKLE